MRKNYYTALQSEIQAFFKNRPVEICVQFLRDFVQFDKWYYVRIFCSYSVIYKCEFYIYDRVSVSFAMCYSVLTEILAFFGRDKPISCSHIIFAFCLFNHPLSEKKRQSQLSAMTTLSFSSLLCVTPPLCYLSPISYISLQNQRRSQLFAMTALSFSLLLCVTPQFYYLSPIGNIFKGGTVSGDTPPALAVADFYDVDVYIL